MSTTCSIVTMDICKKSEVYDKTGLGDKIHFRILLMFAFAPCYPCESIIVTLSLLTVASLPPPPTPAPLVSWACLPPRNRVMTENCHMTSVSLTSFCVLSQPSVTPPRSCFMAGKDVTLPSVISPCFVLLCFASLMFSQ